MRHVEGYVNSVTKFSGVHSHIEFNIVEHLQSMGWALNIIEIGNGSLGTGY